MILQVGLQLYSLREELSKDFDKTLEALAQAGYKGVELAGLHGQKPERINYLLKEFNLELVAMHCDVISPDGLMRSLNEAELLNCSNLICPWQPPETFSTEYNIRKFAEQLNNAGQIINSQGRKLLYHNHDFELKLLNGQYALNILANYLHPSIHFEVDIYLVAVGGANPVGVINSLPSRVDLVHIKDGFLSPDNLNTAIGDGKMDYKGIINALPSEIKWIFVEFETCNTDIFQAVRRSAQYLTVNKLGNMHQ